MSVYDYRFGTSAARPASNNNVTRLPPTYYNKLNMSEEMRSGYADRQASA